MKLLAFAASSSSQSINKQLVRHACSVAEELNPQLEIELLDINDFEMPLFSVDREAELGQPAPAKKFMAKIRDADALLISFAEHNGSYTAAYKSLFDWCSRIDPKVYQNKPAVFLATSPGGRGGATVLATAAESAPRFNAELRATLSIPRFEENFDTRLGVLKDTEHSQQLQAALLSLVAG